MRYIHGCTCLHKQTEAVTDDDASLFHTNSNKHTSRPYFCARGAAYTLVDVQLEFPLGNALLDALAEGGVSRRAAAALSVLDQTAALPEERRGGRAVVAVLFRAEPVHTGHEQAEAARGRLQPQLKAELEAL